MPNTASELARHLAANVEAVCRHYLSNGYRQGRYWLVGDVGNTPGRSLYVRLHGPETGRGADGKWTDAATGEHGDLLDMIAANRRIEAVRDVLDEARRFLAAAPFTPQRRRRLKLLLRALDAALLGVGYREIARDLLGGRVPDGAEWRNHPLRAQTIRLVKDGRALMRGGYLRLLRPDHRKR